jgi:hypothetical protein
MEEVHEPLASALIPDAAVEPPTVTVIPGSFR